MRDAFSEYTLWVYSDNIILNFLPKNQVKLPFMSIKRIESGNGLIFILAIRLFFALIIDDISMFIKYNIK